MKASFLKAGLVLWLLVAPGSWADETCVVAPPDGFAATFDLAGWSPPQQVYTLQNSASSWVVSRTGTVAGLVSCQPAAGWLSPGQTVTVTVTPGPAASTRPIGTYSDNVTFDWQVRIMGDINGNGVVDVIDLLQLQAAFGSVRGGPNYDPLCDFDGDGSVGTLDLLYVLAKFGR